MMRSNVRDKLYEDIPREKVKRPDQAKENAMVGHIDMDAFFASIEERDNPSLCGKPVVVGGPKGSRGVVTTANYVARKYGIHAGMSTIEADRRCPDLIHVGTKGGKYTWVSIEIMNILRRFSPCVEPSSIDEAVIDVTGFERLYNSIEEYGYAIKRAIKDELRLTATIGFGPTRIIAKMASDMQKPDGLTVIRRDEVAKILSPLSVGKIPGIGASTKAALANINIHTIGDLRDCPEEILKVTFGKHGNKLKEIALANSDNVVSGFERRTNDKSMGHEHTFGSDVANIDIIHSYMLYMSEKVSRRMRKKGYLGRVVNLKLRTFDFKTRTHQRHIDDWTDDYASIYTTAKELLTDIWNPGDKHVRLVGISMSGLVKPSEGNGVQTNIFTANRLAARTELFKAIDNIKDTYGEKSLGMAGCLDRYSY
jgi:DNA polymerase IV